MLIDIKKERKRLGLTQKELASALGVSYQTIQNWEKGSVIPKSKYQILGDILFNATKYTDIELLQMIGKIESPTLVNEPKSEYPFVRPSDVQLSAIDEETEIFTNKNGIRFFEYPDGTTKIEVLKIPFHAYASYLEVYNDEEKLMNEFSTTTFTVDKVAKGNYVAFCTKNESMNGGGIYDTPGGAEVLAREIGRHLWKSGFHESKYGFILMTTQAIYHKDIKTYNPETGMILLSSRNPSEEDFEISINTIYRIFNVIKRTF